MVTTTPLSDQLTHAESQGLIRVAQLQPELEYLFRHALVQDAAYESLLRKDRAVLHRAVAQTLEAAYPERLDVLAATLAMHYEAGGDAPAALRYRIRAGQHALKNYANQEAEQHFKQALETAVIVADHFVIYQGLCAALKSRSKMQELLDYASQAYELFLSTNQKDYAAYMAADASTAASALQRGKTADAILQHGLEQTLTIPESLGYGVLLTTYASHLYFKGEFQSALEVIQRAAAITGHGDQLDLHAQALALQGFILMGLNRPEGALLMAEAAELFERIGRIDRAAHTLSNVGALLIGSYEINLGLGRTYLQRAIELGKRTGDAPRFGFSASVLAMAELITGNFAAADQFISQIETDSFHYENYQTVVMQNTALALREFYHGNIAAGRQRLLEMYNLLHEANNQYYLHFVANDLVTMEIHMGLWDQARTHLEHARKLPQADLSWVIWTNAQLIAVYAHHGRLIEAHQLIEQARQAAAAIPSPQSHMRLLEAEIRLAVAEGHWEQADSHIVNLMRLYEKHDLKVYHTLMLVEYAAYLAAHDPYRAHTLLREARAEFEQMGAAGWVETIDRRLRELA